MEQETIIESNKPNPLKIFRKRAKRISTRDYYANTNLKEWDVQQLIKDRVNKEAEAFYA